MRRDAGVLYQVSLIMTDRPRSIHGTVALHEGALPRQTGATSKNARGAEGLSMHRDFGQNASVVVRISIDVVVAVALDRAS